MNVDHTVEFLQTLEPDENHIFYWSGLHPDDRRLQDFGTLEQMLPRLVQRNDEGFGIFICVNAITPSYEGGFPRRKASQVNRVRAVFADWDKANQEPPALPLEPSIVVETSLRKYHFYWLCDDMPLDKFSQAQRGISQALGSDRSITDLSREMRVPGFLHTKDMHKRRPVELLQCTGISYGADEILGAFPYRDTLPKAPIDMSDLRTKSAMTAAVVHHIYPKRDDGGYNVPCPWEFEHTTPSNPTSTVYYPPNPDYGPQGYFKCMHSHCAHRTASDYDDWISIRVVTAIV